MVIRRRPHSNNQMFTILVTISCKQAYIEKYNKSKSPLYPIIETLETTFFVSKRLRKFLIILPRRRYSKFKIIVRAKRNSEFEIIFILINGHHHTIFLAFGDFFRYIYTTLVFFWVYTTLYYCDRQQPRQHQNRAFQHCNKLNVQFVAVLWNVLSKQPGVQHSAQHFHSNLYKTTN